MEPVFTVGPDHPRNLGKLTSEIPPYVDLDGGLEANKEEEGAGVRSESYWLGGWGKGYLAHKKVPPPP